MASVKRTWINNSVIVSAEKTGNIYIYIYLLPFYFLNFYFNLYNIRYMIIMLCIM